MAENVKEYINLYKSGFQKFEENLNGQSTSFIHRIRKDAFTKFVDKGFPTTKLEEWKYTNVDSIAKTEFNLELPKTKIQKSDVEKFFIKNLDCYKLVFINGRYDSDLSDNFESENDFSVSNLQIYIKENLDSDSQKLTKLADYNSDSFIALNTAFMQDGIAINIKKEISIDKPFFLLFVSSGENESNLNQPRILFESQANSKAVVVESFQSIQSDKDLGNVVAEFHLEENARVEHIKIQNQSESSYHISNLYAKLEKNSYLKTLDINLGGKITRTNLFTKLSGEGSECVLNGVYIGNGTQHIDNRTVIEHEKPHCLSTQTYKGIVGDNARGVFNGKIHVYQEAQKTNAIQNNSGLLLSDNASIDTKPQLEIYADDVRCTHGATIGQLDEEALFYLRSRAIDVQQAKKMLINAFTGEVIDQVENEILWDRIQEYIIEKLKLIA
jgi:Fe-S cluster assembly protein SufD